MRRKAVEVLNVVPSHLKKSKISELEIQCNEDINYVDPNICCMYFVQYEDDILQGACTKWILWACGRWLHEDYIDVMDDN